MFQYLCLYFSFFHHPKNTGGSGNLPHCRPLIYSLFFFFRLGNNQCTNLLMTFKSHFQMVTRPKIQKNIVIPSMVPLIEASINIFNVSIAYRLKMTVELMTAANEIKKDYQKICDSHCGGFETADLRFKGGTHRIYL